MLTLINKCVQSVLRMQGSAIILAVAAVLLCQSCNQPFSPKAPFEARPVVYSVIYTDRSQQFVRVYTTYDVSGYNPYENTTDRAVAGATVSVTGPQGTCVFRDTVLFFVYTSGYKIPIAAYVADWRPEPGVAYTLVVNAGDAGSTSATVTTPPLSASYSWYPSTVFLDDPDTNKYVTAVSAIFQASESMKAHFQQVFITYAVQIGAGWQEENVQLWVDTFLNRAGGTYAAVVGFRGDILTILHQISGKYAGTKLTFKRIVFRLLLMDENWYDYYTMVRRAQDSLTTRSDQPDFTNLSNGYGLFGACTVDSLVHDYPADFKYNH